MTNSREKGKRGEREAANYLTAIGLPARRTQQYNGDGLSDVVVDGLAVSIEVKYGYPRGEFDLGTKLWEAATEQAHEDADGPWVVLWRPRSCRTWRITYQECDGYLSTRAGDAAIRATLEMLGTGGGG